jgi:outer membrane immunogenic protein
MKHRTLLLAATALSLVVGSSAYAADLPTKAPYAPIAPAPVTTWTGFYVGLNAGFGWASTDATVAGSDLDGFVGGGQVGYNWQSGNWVFGVEGDFQGSAQDTSSSGAFPGLGTVTLDQEIPWFATMRGRLGYAWGPWLLYATGGAAWVNYQATFSAAGVSVEDDATNFAWTVGGGVEWMFAPKWSAKLEYLYIDTGDTDVTLFGVPFTARAKDNIVRAGINYHF